MATPPNDASDDQTQASDQQSEAPQQQGETPDQQSETPDQQSEAPHPQTQPPHEQSQAPHPQSQTNNWDSISARLEQQNIELLEMQSARQETYEQIQRARGRHFIVVASGVRALNAHARWRARAQETNAPEDVERAAREAERVRVMHQEGQSEWQEFIAESLRLWHEIDRLDGLIPPLRRALGLPDQ